MFYSRLSYFTIHLLGSSIFKPEVSVWMEDAVSWNDISSSLMHFDKNSPAFQKIPPHNTGAAIDIEIIAKSGDLINMGMAIKDWSDVDPKICATDCKLVNQQVQKNRKTLLEIMQQEGFVNYPTEWWHFSYGDRYWAYHQAIKQAIYGCMTE